MSLSPTTPPSGSCQRRNSTNRRMEDGDQQTLVHALALGLRRSSPLRDAADRSPKIPVSPFPSSQLYHDMRQEPRLSHENHRTNMTNILDAALSISDEVALEQHLLNSQTSVGSMSSTESADDTEPRQQ